VRPEEAEEIKEIEWMAEKTWYRDGQEITWDEFSKLKAKEKPLKVYRYGKYGDVELHKFSKFAVVNYIPTNTLFFFNNINNAFEFAKARAEHARVLSKLFR